MYFLKVIRQGQRCKTVKTIKRNERDNGAVRKIPFGGVSYPEKKKIKTIDIINGSSFDLSCAL